MAPVLLIGRLPAANKAGQQKVPNDSHTPNDDHVLTLW